MAGADPIGGDADLTARSVQTALDACCSALVALEAARAEIERLGGQAGGAAYAADLRAMESVRGTISELRRYRRPADASLLAGGFVRPAPGAEPPQSSSLRIA